MGEGDNFVGEGQGRFCLVVAAKRGEREEGGCLTLVDPTCVSNGFRGMGLGGYLAKGKFGLCLFLGGLVNRNKKGPVWFVINKTPQGLKL